MPIWAWPGAVLSLRPGLGRKGPRMNEWIIVGIIARLVLIFGAKKLPELARGVGASRREFKRGLEDDE